MKYLVDKAYVVEEGSTRFYEFRKGKLDYEHDENPHWKDDSLYIEDAAVYELQLDTLFSETMEGYDCTCETVVTPQRWEIVKTHAFQVGGEWQGFIEEITPWVEDTFTVFECFTISGM